MKRKLQLSDEERRRIELKFESMRRSDKYRRDYEMQQEHKQELKNEDVFLKLEDRLFHKWFHFPLLPPDVPIDTYREKKKNKYPFWLETTLSGLITSDPLCPQFVKIDSPELRKYLEWKKRGYKTTIKVNEGISIKVSFPKGDEVFNQIDAGLIEQELRNVKLFVDMYDFDLTQFRKRMDLLFRELKPLVKRFLYKEQERKGRRIAVRNSATLDYLKTYDRKKKMSYGKMNEDEDQQRKFKEHVKYAKALIKGGWHYI